jgi:hypothetical protein
VREREREMTVMQSLRERKGSDGFPTTSPVLDKRNFLTQRFNLNGRESAGNRVLDGSIYPG